MYSQWAVGHALNSCHNQDDKHSILSPVLSCVAFAVVHQNFLSRWINKRTKGCRAWLTALWKYSFVSKHVCIKQDSVQRTQQRCHYLCPLSCLRIHLINVVNNGTQLAQFVLLFIRTCSSPRSASSSACSAAWLMGDNNMTACMAACCKGRVGKRAVTC